ncbi:MAG: haloacid dehalogenase [Rhodospirillales bacterium]|jgi:YrbI family 3-deoxy-D-manno-octulosonate 8-phosphate phosphatase|nr:haloacid dehalogenase [Rhodospirillales bacterium]
MAAPLYSAVRDAELVARIRKLRLMAFDFDGVFTDNAVIVFEDGREAVRCSRLDGLGLRRLETVGIEPIILSTETNLVVGARAAKLKIKARQGLDDKLAALREEVTARGLCLDEVGYVGNDINDASCLKAVGVPIVVGDCHPDVLPLGLYRTTRPGGNGAVREVCDLVHAVRTGSTEPLTDEH